MNVGISIVSSTVHIVEPWFSSSGIQDMSIAIFEVEFSQDLYINHIALSEYSLDSIYWDANGNLYPGEIVWALSGAAAILCPGFSWWLMGESTDVNDAPLFVLPAIDNPLGLVYGWQFDDSISWPSNKLVVALPLTVSLCFGFLR